MTNTNLPKLGPDDLAEWQRVSSMRHAISEGRDTTVAMAFDVEMEGLKLVARFYEVYDLEPDKYYRFNPFTGVITEE